MGRPAPREVSGRGSGTGWCGVVRSGDGAGEGYLASESVKWNDCDPESGDSRIHVGRSQKRKGHVVAGSWCALTFACQGIPLPRLVYAHAYIALAHGRRAASSAKLGANASPGNRVEGTRLSKSHLPGNGKD